MYLFDLGFFCCFFFVLVVVVVFHRYVILTGQLNLSFNFRVRLTALPQCSFVI